MLDLRRSLEYLLFFQQRERHSQMLQCCYIHILLHLRGAHFNHSYRTYTATINSSKTYVPLSLFKVTFLPTQVMNYLTGIIFATLYRYNVGCSVFRSSFRKDSHCVCVVVLSHQHAPPLGRKLFLIKNLLNQLLSWDIKGNVQK